jgi:hypothetical protein
VEGEHKIAVTALLEVVEGKVGRAEDGKDADSLPARGHLD